MNPIEQQFFNDLEKKLWTAADKLRSSLDASVYKHVVLGLIFLKYVSDAFEERQNELRAQFQNPEHDYYMDPAEYGGAGTPEYEENIAAELEVRDYYTEKNVFWVPLEARWQTLRDCAQIPPGDALPWNAQGKDTPEKMRTVGWLIDNAMEAVERENPKLKNVLNKDFVRTQIDSHKLADLIAHFSDTNFSQPTFGGQALSLKSKDILGHVYEYFLGQFALAEGKKGSQYYTPKSIVTLIVQMLQPFKGRVYDPAMGSGGFFVQSEEFIAEHGGAVVKGKTGQISVYGQESNPTTWKLAAMNMAIRGLDFNFGGQPGDTLQNDLHPDLRADYVMANPPFNMKEWWSAKLENDPRWLPGCTPPQGNANFAWLQHMLYHLAPTGSMALLLADLMRRFGICEEKSSGIDRVIETAEIMQLPAPEFLTSHRRTVVVIHGPRAFREMNGSDRVRACYQHCVLQYVLRKQMTNQSLRERFGLSESSGNTVSQIITATVDQRLIKNDPNAPDSKRYARYIPAWA